MNVEFARIRYAGSFIDLLVVAAMDYCAHSRFLSSAFRDKWTGAGPKIPPEKISVRWTDPDALAADW